MSVLSKIGFAGPKIPHTGIIALAVLICASLLPVAPVFAKTLTQAEIRTEMLNKTIVTRRFGLRITMRYRPNGTVSAKTLVGSLNGTWRYRGNRVCTTFPSGPAKGTSCVSFRKTGPKSFVSSEGVSFSVR
ncbi:MAG: hypothetical protein AAF035_13260 [Pseudomonadota bacterium]